MKKINLTYTEPITTVTDITMEGFICSSEIMQVTFQSEVDELVNQGEEIWWLND